MSKVLKVTLILILLTTSVCFAQKRRAKKQEKQKKEQREEGEEGEVQEEGEDQNFEEEITNTDDLNIDEEEEEGSDSTNKEKPSEAGGTKFKIKKGPSKVLLLFEKFHFNFSSGYGVTSWRSKSYKFGYYNPTDNINDTSFVKFKGLGLNVPFHVQILYEIGKVRFGGGASYEFYLMKYLKPNEFEDILVPDTITGIGGFKKYYGHISYKYFETKKYACLADLEVGLFTGSKAVNNVGNGKLPFINIGVTMERKYSEYFRMFIKPSIEYKTQPFLITNREITPGINNHRQLTLYVQWGVSYSIPILSKCPIKSCGVRIHHYHGTRMFRGNPFHRLQNPNYGEEDRKFIRMRGKNKTKMDPY